MMSEKPAAIAGTCGVTNATAPDPIIATISGQSRLSRTVPGRCWSGSVVVARAPASSRAIGGVVSARRPSTIPITAATDHHAAQNTSSPVSSSPAAPAIATAASAVAAAAHDSTVVLRKSTKRTSC
jgi:hypothetical protein